MSETETHARAEGKKRGLGMGLSALLGAGGEAPEQAGGATAREIPIEMLRPSRVQPRRRFTEADLTALADSIRARGVMQPLLVRPDPDRDDAFEIIAGERRWRAAQQAGLHDLPVIVQPLSDREALEVALVENVQRQDLSPLEEAEGYRRLIDEFGHTQEALATALGRSRSHIANLLRLLGLPDGVRTMVEAGELSAGHARALLSAKDPVTLAKTVVARGLNVRQTETLVRADNERRERQRRAAVDDPDTRALERDLSSRLGVRVSVRRSGSGGTLSIRFRSAEQLQGLIERLG